MNRRSVVAALLPQIDSAILVAALLATIFLAMLNLALVPIGPKLFRASTVTAYPGCPEVVLDDIDGDGDLDVLVGGGLWLNDGDGKFCAFGHEQGAMDRYEAPSPKSPRQNE